MKKNFRLLALAVAGWYVIGLPALLDEARDKQAVSLRIHLRSSVQSTLQVFFDKGQGIREEDSVSTSIFHEGEFLDYYFAMPPTKVLVFRFDPATTAGEITVASADIVNIRGEVLHAFALTDFSPLNQIKSLRLETDGLHITTDDPAPDPALTIHLTAALDFSESGRLSTKTWIVTVGWHTLAALLVAGIILALGNVVQRYWGKNWLDFSLPANEEIEWIPIALYFYMASVSCVLAVSAFCLEQMLFKIML